MKKSRLISHPDGRWPGSPRIDGRPEAYDIKPGSFTNCDQCAAFGDKKLYGYRQVFIITAAQSPLDNKAPATLCKDHIPESIVIVDPHKDGECRDLQGNAWHENELGEKIQ